MAHNFLKQFVYTQKKAELLRSSQKKVIKGTKLIRYLRLAKDKGLKVKDLQNLGYFLQKNKSTPKWQARTSFLKQFFAKS